MILESCQHPRVPRTYFKGAKIYHNFALITRIRLHLNITILYFMYIWFNKAFLVLQVSTCSAKKALLNKQSKNIAQNLSWPSLKLNTNWTRESFLLAKMLSQWGSILVWYLHISQKFEQNSSDRIWFCIQPYTQW